VGNGVAGMNGDGLPPLSTALYLPQDGTYGPGGEFYFVDWNNHRIRKIHNGVIETVAGSGYIGDGADGPALTMPLNHPTHISFDKQGRLLIAAWHNSKVKRIDFTTGLAVNIAGTGARAYGGDGGPANAARLDLPSSVVEDSQGGLCISDQANFRIRRVGLDGNINTTCGTGVAGYSGDNGLAIAATIRSPVGQSAPPAGRIDIDAQDRIYIADTGNHVIRLIDTDGKIRTIAGTGVPGYSGDNGPATQAQLNVPSDVAVAPDGTIYIADTKNNRVRRVGTDGIITTFAGTGTQGYSGDGTLARNAKLDRPYGVAIAPSGAIVISDTHNHRIRIVTEEPIDNGPSEEEPPIVVIPCTGEVGSICTYAGSGFQGFTGDGKDRQRSALDQPADIEFTPSGRVYLLDWNNHKVRQVLPDQTLQTVMGSDFVGDGPLDLSDLTAPGAPGLTVDLNHPTDVQEFPNGDLMVMAWHNHKIRVLYPDTGLVRVIAGGGVGFFGDLDPAGAKVAKLNQPPHGVLDPSGNLFFIDQRNQRIRMITNFAGQRENAIINTIAGTGTPGFNGDGPALATQFSFPTGTNPEPSGGIARAADGTLYFADTWNHRLRKVTFTGGDFTTGAVTTIAGTGTAGDSGDGGPALSAMINNPLDLELGPDGKLYFADTNNNRVRRIDLTAGTIEAVAGTGVRGYSGDGGPALTATFDRPFGVAFDPFGNLYISDTFNNRIRKVKLTTTPEGPEPIVPADYAASYVEVRDCRFSLEHGGVYIRVLTSPEAAQPYLKNASPLPVGSVVVKEEYSDGECEAEELLRWRAMRKEAPGFDPQDGDWHWQWLTPRREVVYNEKSTCIGCHVRPDCLGRDYMCTLEGSKGMKPVLDNLPATLVSVSGLPPEDGHNHGAGINFEVFAVGADPGDGRGPFIIRYDHNVPAWKRLDSGAKGDLWWVSDHRIDGDMYMCGADGLILRYTPASETFERMKTPGGKLLFGVWGTDRNNLWAVGGDLSNEDTGGAIWRFNGTEWVADALAPAGLPTLYKVWGRAPDDVYAVGRLGAALHWSGVQWTPVTTGTTRQLFTVHGNDTRVVATGGAFTGLILELAGNAFVDRTPAGAPQMNGVFVSAGPAVAVGVEGNYATLGGQGWELQTPVTAAKPMDFHGSWIDSAGGIWAVGGDLTVDKSYGVLAYSGQGGVSPNFISDAPCASGAAVGPVGALSYLRDVLPIFTRAGCTASTCHGGPAPESQYNLKTYQGLFGAGQAARNYGMCDVVPGNPRASFLLEKLQPNPRSGVQMPNGLVSLTAAQIDIVRNWILQGAVEDAPLSRNFSRGDPNADGAADLTDAIAILDSLFLGGGELGCEKAGDADDNGTLEITDAIAQLGYLFLGNPAFLPAPSFPGCGVDLTRDVLDCDQSRCQ
jgi:sugar lactone lactonase YvrE